MPLPVWIALLFVLFVTAAGAVYVFLRARRFMRTAKSASAEMDGPMRHLERSVDELNAKMEAAENATPRLEASVTRLRRSVARLMVLQAALQDTRDSFAWLAAVYPRK
jgi:hypothetical protein